MTESPLSREADFRVRATHTNGQNPDNPANQRFGVIACEWSRRWWEVAIACVIILSHVRRGNTSTTIPPVKILLPPSETKSDGTLETPLNLEALSFPELTKSRKKVVSALIALSKKPKVARERLEISQKLDGERLRNIELLTAKTSPAHSIYSGVLYDALAYHDLDIQAKSVADNSLIVQSALFGWVTFADLIPPYRLSGDTKLLSSTSLAQLWKPAISQAMKKFDSQELIIDMRSGNYAQHWTPGVQEISRTVVVKVVQFTGSGGDKKKIAVSHFNKATKGKIARSLVTSNAGASSSSELHELLSQLGYNCELFAGDSKKAATLEVEMV